MTESDLEFLLQEHGPALGLYQMEPDTITDVWENYLLYRHDLAGKVRTLMVEGMSRIEQVPGNLYYATALAAIKYLRVPDLLPDLNDIEAQAVFWKTHYNTSKGAGKTDEYIAYKEYLLDPSLWS